MKRIRIISILLYSSILISCASDTTSKDVEKQVESVAQEVEDQVNNVVQAEEEHVLMVKHGYPLSYPNCKYGDVFDNFFGSPTWKYFEADTGEQVVEFTGYCMYHDTEVKSRLQFILDMENNTFEAGAMSFNNVPQTTLVTTAMIEKAFEHYIEEKGIQNYDENNLKEELADVFVSETAAMEGEMNQTAQQANLDAMETQDDKNDYLFDIWTLSGEYEGENVMPYTIMSISIYSSPEPRSDKIGNYIMKVPQAGLEDTGELRRDSDKIFSLISYEGNYAKIEVIDDTFGAVVIHYVEDDFECNFRMYAANIETGNTQDMNSTQAAISPDTPYHSDEGDTMFTPHIMIENSSNVYLSDSDVYWMTPDQLRFAINEIYARHGRLFKDEILQEWFNEQEWYQGWISPEDFDESVLSELEKANIQILQHRREVNSRP